MCALHSNTYKHSLVQTPLLPKPLSDCFTDQKPVLTSFLCENTLQFSLAGDLADLTKFLAKGKLALAKLHFSCTSSIYITTHRT